MSRVPGDSLWSGNQVLQPSANSHVADQAPKVSKMQQRPKTGHICQRSEIKEAVCTALQIAAVRRIEIRFQADQILGKGKGVATFSRLA